MLFMLDCVFEYPFRGDKWDTWFWRRYNSKEKEQKK